MSPPDEPQTLERDVRAAVRDALGAEVDAFAWLPGQLGLRRFARVRVGARSIVARVDAPEDPASRPAGVPPEPPLEPTGQPASTDPPAAR